MQCLGKVESGANYFWCGRCGTLKDRNGLGDFDTRPALVDRCQRFSDWAITSPLVGDIVRKELYRVGILEAILTEIERSDAAVKA
jgi:hypothetical protein